MTQRRSTPLWFLAALAAASCSSSPTTPEVASEFAGVDVGPEGGDVTPPTWSNYAGVSLRIPAGALSTKVRVSFQGVVDETPLPETAERVGAAFKVLPEGTSLKIPAELTLPVDRQMVQAYEQSASSCKVWARKDGGWTKLEAIRTGKDSVTVPISSFTTAAAGVNFSVATTCASRPEACTAGARGVTPVDLSTKACEKLNGSPFCLAKLPLDEGARGLDEFASLNVVGTNVFWAAKSDDGITVHRYDLANPGAIFKYPSYTGAVSGSATTQGWVAAASTVGGPVWVGVAGIGNIKFPEQGLPSVFDSPGSAGVLVSGTGLPQRFRKVNVVSGNIVTKTDLRVYEGEGSAFDFAFNYPTLPGENIAGVQFGTMLVRSVHRGLAQTSHQGGALSDFMKWDAQDGRLGTQSDDDDATYGAAAFSDGLSGIAAGLGAIVRGTTLEIRANKGYQTLLQTVAPPGGVRDMAFCNAGGSPAVCAVSSRAELYIIQISNGSFVTVPLPTDDPGMVPWRLHTIPGTSDLLLVTRGDIQRKGTFYRIKFAA